MDERSCYILLVLLEQSDYITFQEISDLILERYQYTCNIKSIGASIRSINLFFELIFGISDAIEVIKKKGSKINKMLINRGELRFLFDALTTNNSIPSQEGFELYQKLTRLIPVYERSTMVENNQHSLTLTYLNTIIKAISNQRSIRFQYINYTYDNGKLEESISNYGNFNDPSYYVVSPYKVIMENGKYYLVGYYSKHENNTTNFRLDRMRNVVSYKKSLYVDKNDEWDIENQIQNNVNMYSGSHEITLELYCHRRVLRAVVDEFKDHISEVVLSNDPDYLNIKIDHIVESYGLVGWIMMMSPQVKILSPNTLVEKIKDQLNQTIQIYQ